MDAICKVDGCDRKAKNSGWCGMHYQRYWRYGDPLGGGPQQVGRLPTGATNEEKFWVKVDKNGPVATPELGPCWLWTASYNFMGYGQFRPTNSAENPSGTAHRYSFWLANGYFPPPEDAVDHLCRNTLCVNPDHLEHVTRRENILRGTAPTAVNARKTHCPQGHEYTEENTDLSEGSRRCRTCRRKRNAERQRARYAELRAAREARNGGG